jgi:hypothetical protein
MKEKEDEVENKSRFLFCWPRHNRKFPPPNKSMGRGLPERIDSNPYPKERERERRETRTFYSFSR